MKNTMKKLAWNLAIGLLVVGTVTPVKAAIFSIDTVDGDWANALPVAGVTVAIRGRVVV